MADVVAWISEHWRELVAIVGAVLTLASFITALTKTPKDDEVVRKIIAFLSFLQPRTSAGTLKVPGVAPAKDTSVPFDKVEDPGASRLRLVKDEDEDEPTPFR